MTSTIYIVYGDYGYTTEEELYETVSLNAAIRWAKKYVDKHGLCGYDVIEVGWHDDSGEYVTEWSKKESEYVDA